MLPEVGLTELLVIGLVALLVLKPADVPILMRKLGLWYVHARRYLYGFAVGLEEDAPTPAPPARQNTKKPRA
jgi:sec-independent protein translocase protein TatB